MVAEVLLLISITQDLGLISPYSATVVGSQGPISPKKVLPVFTS